MGGFSPLLRRGASDRAAIVLVVVGPRPDDEF
jgi:hypothetical protein